MRPRLISGVPNSISTTGKNTINAIFTFADRRFSLNHILPFTPGLSAPLVWFCDILNASFPGHVSFSHFQVFANRAICLMWPNDPGRMNLKR